MDQTPSAKAASLSVFVYVLLVLGVLAAIGIGYRIVSLEKVVDTRTQIQKTTDAVQEFVVDEAPTDLARIGTLSFDPNQTIGQAIPTFTSVDASGATSSAQLVYDGLSFCVSDNGALPCIMMSIRFNQVYDGKRALIEGIKERTGILVRTMRILEDGETPVLPATGISYIAWDEARQQIHTCEVSSVMQAHSLNVHLNLKTGKTVQTYEPVIDEVSRVIDEAAATCGSIPFATE